jgi:hypothetical protein
MYPDVRVTGINLFQLIILFCCLLQMRRVLYMGKNTAHTIRKVPNHMLPCTNGSKMMNNKSWHLSADQMSRKYDTVENLPRLVTTYCNENSMFKHQGTLYYNDSIHNRRVLSWCPTCDKKCMVSRPQRPQHKSWKKTKGTHVPDIDTSVDVEVS